MPKYTLNTKKLYVKAGKSKALQRAFDKKANLLVEENKKLAILELENHPVSQEIKAGPSAHNTSGTLGGYGNLFSFIGFMGGSQPINSLSRLIKSVIRINQFRGGKNKKVKNKKIEFRYRVSLPSKDEIVQATPMPWEGGSWAEGIENGISNFSYYMYKRFGEGRSGWGFQADHELRMAVFKPKKYVSGILENFNKNIRKGIKKI